jgi:hypothetical protein
MPSPTVAPDRAQSTRFSSGRALESSFIPALLTITLVGLALAPILVSGYMGDEGRWQSFLRGGLLVQPSSVRDLMVQANRSFMSGMGRFDPLATYYVPLFVYIKSLAVYKLLMWLIALLSLYAFYRLIRTITCSTSHAVLATLLVSVTIQFQSSMDPLLGFYGIWPLLAAGLFASLEMFAVGIRDGRRNLEAGGVFVYLCCCLLYDIAYSFVPLYLWVIWNYERGRRAALRSLIPVLSVPALLAAITLAIRSDLARSTSSAPYEVNTNIGGAVGAYVVNIVGALPFVHHITHPMRLISEADYSTNLAVLLFGLLILLAFAALIPRLPLSEPPDHWSLSRRTTLTLAGLGIMLLLLPPVLISLSAKYQEYARSGGVYIQVFIEYFGIAVLATIVVSGMLPALGRVSFRAGIVLRNVVLVLLFGLAAVNAFCNARVVVNSWPEWRDSRAMMALALHAGLLNDVPDGAILAIEREKFPWDNPFMYPQETGRRFAVMQLDGGGRRDLVARFARECGRDSGHEVCRVSTDRPLYVVYKHYAGEGSGFALVSRVRAFGLDANSDIATMLADNATMFVASPVLATGSGELDITTSSCRQLLVPAGCSITTMSGAKATVIAAASSWRMVRFPPQEIIEPSTLRVSLGLTDRRSVPLGDLNAAEQAPELPQSTAVSVDLINEKPLPLKGQAIPLGPGQRTLNVQGWATDQLLHQPASGVVITVEPAGSEGAKLTTRADYGIQRPDVAVAMKNPALSASGYRAFVDCRSLANGRYRVTVRALSADGQRYFRGGPAFEMELR